MRRLGPAARLVLFAGALAAAAPHAAAQGPGEAPGLDDLARRNKELEDRVRRLEGAALAEDVARYLEERLPSAEAAGAESLVPGARALRISGEIRVREEIQDHLYSPKDAAGDLSFDFAHMRTRLRFDVDIVENLAAVVEFQDIRTLGEEGSTTADAEGVDLKRGTIVFKRIAAQPLDVELGRFVMAYGDQRLIGHLEWFDQGRTYDGLRAIYKGETIWLDAFAVRVRETLTPDDDQWFTGLYGGRDWLEAYALLFSDDMAMAGETVTDDSRFVTLGLRIADKTGDWDYSTEVVVQLGDLRGDDLDAFGFAVVFGRTFPEAGWRPRVAFEVDYATGDEDPTDGDSEQLQTLFPTNHLHYGYADLLGWSNLLDLHLKIQMKPMDRVTVEAGYHHFRRPEEAGAWVNAGGAIVRPGLAGSSSHLGDEVDLTVTWKPKDALAFLLGYSLFLPGGFVEDTGPSPVAHFIYLETRVTW
jgi:hypothetical protein